MHKLEKLILESFAELTEEREAKTLGLEELPKSFRASIEKRYGISKWPEKDFVSSDMKTYFKTTSVEPLTGNVGHKPISLPSFEELYSNFSDIVGDIRGLMGNQDIRTDKKARELILGITEMKDLVLEHYELRLFSKLIKLLMTQVEALNEFVSHKEPWVLAKNEDQHKVNSELHQICSTCLHSFRLVSIFLTPIIPELTSKIALFFNESPYESFSSIDTETDSITNYVHLLQMQYQCCNML